MKKVLCLFMVMVVLLTGCGENTQDKDDKSKTTSTTSSTSSSTSTSSTTTTKSTTSKRTTTSTTTKKPTTTTKAKNVYKSVKTGKEHKYSFVYNDEATCIKRGDGDAYDIVNPVHPYVVFGCEEIEDSNGNKLWGVFFYEHTDENSIFYY